MKKLFAALPLLIGTVSLATEAPEAWRTVCSSNAAEAALANFTGGIARCTWAGNAPDTCRALPANAAFQFAIAGHADCVTNAQRALDAAIDAIPRDLLERLRKSRMLNSTLQWLIRSRRAGGTDPARYLRPQAHLAAFSESDFDLVSLTNAASHLDANSIPPAAAVLLVDELYKLRPTEPTVAGIDYPDFHPEITFATPFGVGIVLRAPECVRRFRFRALSWPSPKMPASFTWVAMGGGVQIRPWSREESLEMGCATIRIDRRGLSRNPRADVAVFARFQDGSWGAPSIISFYASPYESREYQRDGKLEKIVYQTHPRQPPPYDISPICLPANWTDYYQYDDQGRIFGFSRTAPLGTRSETFSNLGERILEYHAGDTPKTTIRIRYFEQDGELKYEETGEEINYRLKTPVFRLRGI